MSTATRQVLPRAALSLALGLSLFGLYESIDALASLMRQRAPANPVSELFRYAPWASIHFVPGALFMIACPLQLWASFRNADRARHRVLGRVVMAASVALGASGLLLPFTMPSRPVGEQVFMTCFGLFFLWCTARALAAARRRDFATHRRWAIRMYVGGLTITTQRIFTPAFAMVFGIDSVSQFWFDFVGAGWLAWGVQTAAAEWWLRAPSRRRPPPSSGEGLQAARESASRS